MKNFIFLRLISASFVFFTSTSVYGIEFGDLSQSRSANGVPNSGRSQGSVDFSKLSSADVQKVEKCLKLFTADTDPHVYDQNLEQWASEIKKLAEKVGLNPVPAPDAWGALNSVAARMGKGCPPIDSQMLTYPQLITWRANALGGFKGSTDIFLGYAVALAKNSRSEEGLLKNLLSSCVPLNYSPSALYWPIACFVWQQFLTRKKDADFATSFGGFTLREDKKIHKASSQDSMNEDPELQEALARSMQQQHPFSNIQEKENEMLRQAREASLRLQAEEERILKGQTDKIAQHSQRPVNQAEERKEEAKRGETLNRSAQNFSSQSSMGGKSKNYGLSHQQMQQNAQDTLKKLARERLQAKADEALARQLQQEQDRQLAEDEALALRLQQAQDRQRIKQEAEDLAYARKLAEEY